MFRTPLIDIYTEKRRRDKSAIGGGSIVGKDLGTRQGFEEPRRMYSGRMMTEEQIQAIRDRRKVPKIEGMVYDKETKTFRPRKTFENIDRSIFRAPKSAETKARKATEKLKNFVEKFKLENQGELPTQQQIMNAVGGKSSSVQKYLEEGVDYKKRATKTEAAIKGGEKSAIARAIPEGQDPYYVKRAKTIKEAEKSQSAADKADLKQIEKGKKEINKYFKNNPDAINNTNFGKNVKAMMAMRMDKEGNFYSRVMPDEYYKKKASEGKIYDLFDVKPVVEGGKNLRYPVNVNITPGQFNQAFIQNQVSRAFSRGVNPDSINFLDEYLKEKNIRVKFPEVGYLGAKPDVAVDRKTGDFPRIIKTLEKMDAPSQILNLFKNQDRMKKLENLKGIESITTVDEIKRPEKSKTRDMYKNAFKDGETGFISTDLLKDVGKGAGKLLTAAGTPLGVVGITAGVGIDPTSAVDRATLAAEAALAPSLVKGTSQLTKNALLQKLFNLGLSPRAAMRVARIASPLGIASLGGEALYQYGKFVKDELERIENMTPEEREAYNADQEEQMGMSAANGGLITREAFKDGFDPKKRQTMKILGGLASIPVLGKYIKILGPLAPKVVETVERSADAIPNFIYDLIAKIKADGPKFFTGNRAEEFEYVYRKDGYEVREQGNKITVRKSDDPDNPYYKEMEMELELDPETGGVTYKEATARPDGDGKLKDIEESIDDVDLQEMEKYTYDE